MLTIRFARVGKKKKAQFKIMLQEHTAAPGGRHVEVLGSYDPHKKVAVLKEDRIKFWLSKGAQNSDTVHNLLVSKGLVKEKKRTVKVPKKPIEETKVEEKVETVKTEVKPVEVKSEAPAVGEVKSVEAKTEEIKDEVKAAEIKPKEPQTPPPGEVKTEIPSV
jgi:small subunit ribosomal protein S16